MQRYAVIPTRDRPEKYAKCLASIRPQVDVVVTVAHHSPPYVYNGETVVPYEEEPPNISRMWNKGLDACERLAHEAEGEDAEWLVAILNDDIQVCTTWFDRIEEAMLRDETVLGSGPGPSPVMILGAAFVLRGGTISADESWGWWGSDNAINEQAMQHWGGWSKVPKATTWHDREDLPEGPLLTSARKDLERWLALHTAPLGLHVPLGGEHRRRR